MHVIHICIIIIIFYQVNYFFPINGSAGGPYGPICPLHLKDLISTCHLIREGDQYRAPMIFPRCLCKHDRPTFFAASCMHLSPRPKQLQERGVYRPICTVCHLIAKCFSLMQEAIKYMQSYITSPLSPTWIWHTWWCRSCYPCGVATRYFLNTCMPRCSLYHKDRLPECIQLPQKRQNVGSNKMYCPRTILFHPCT